MRYALVLLAALLLSGFKGCQHEEPKFRDGDVVAYRLLPIVGVVREVHCRWGVDCRYSVRHGDGTYHVADERELELIGRQYETRP